MRIYVLVICILSLLISVISSYDQSVKVNNLPGFGTTKEDEYCGYLNVDVEHRGYLFYWLYESQSSKPDDDPLVIWLTGGPGCSSEFASFFENGPYKMKDDSSTELKSNPYTWNKFTNTLFIDNPVGTGFSVVDDSGLVKNETEVADDLYRFLQLFLLKYPKFRHRSVFLTGESYGGHYLPSFGKRIIEGNADTSSINFYIDLQGVAIGNGWIDPSLQYPSYIDYSVKYGLITDKTENEARQYVDGCTGNIASKNWATAQGVCSNITDIIIDNVLVPNFNMYNYKTPCEGDLCYDDTHIANYLNSDVVQNTLHVDREWCSCNMTVNHHFSHKDMLFSTAPWIAVILEAKVRVLLYFGMLDYQCNYIGGSAVAKSIPWYGKDSFASAPTSDWVLSGESVGSMKSFEPLSFLKVKEAGHMVPHDKPIPALEMLRLFITDSQFPGPSSNSSDDDSDTGTVIGVTLGALVLCFLLSIILCLYNSRKRKSEEENTGRRKGTNYSKIDNV